jgi:hypothetical protein
VSRTVARGWLEEGGRYTSCNDFERHGIGCRCAAQRLARVNLGYPEGYRDPEYDGTPEGFAAVVLPARAAALLCSLNETYAGTLPEGVTFEWRAGGWLVR